MGVPIVNYNYNGAFLNDLDISEESVHMLSLKLDLNKSAGPDGITTRLLRECSEHLIVPLTIIFKKSLESGDVPMAWRAHPRGNKMQITFDFFLQIPSNISVFRNAGVLQLNPCSIL